MACRLPRPRPRAWYLLLSAPPTARIKTVCTPHTCLTPRAPGLSPRHTITCVPRVRAQPWHNRCKPRWRSWELISARCGLTLKLKPVYTWKIYAHVNVSLRHAVCELSVVTHTCLIGSDRYNPVSPTVTSLVPFGLRRTAPTQGACPRPFTPAMTTANGIIH